MLDELNKGNEAKKRGLQCVTEGNEGPDDELSRYLD